MTRQSGTRDTRPMATPDELAVHLRVSVNTVYRWNTEGTGPKFTKLRGHTRYRWTDIEDWIEQQPASAPPVVRPVPMTRAPRRAVS